MGHISDLREIVGTRPLMMPGSCVVVLNEAREILLQKRSDSLDWGTIGGALELGESFEEAATRELHEEAGEPTGDNDEGEGLELRYFPLDQPIHDLNRMSRLVLTKAGYLR
jgi:8-oxo-dGTP pyrophosphatase MutT (NUDIX family)